MGSVDNLLRLYRRLPGTSHRVRPADRKLAADLFHQQIPFERLRAALLLGCARRLASSSHLPPIQSLHYFLPILDELRKSPLEEGYLAYLEQLILQQTAPSPPSCRRFTLPPTPSIGSPSGT
ncbi:MAG: hypothetical protein ACREMY_27515 [bacterium]